MIEEAPVSQSRDIESLLEAEGVTKIGAAEEEKNKKKSSLGKVSSRFKIVSRKARYAKLKV